VFITVFLFCISVSFCRFYLART